MIFADGKMNYKNLFSPIKINGMVSRNRIVASPIGDYFEEKALGGAGIVICGHTIVDPGRSSFARADEPYIFSKYSVEEARSRIRKCHQSGTRASLELFHAGQYARVNDYAIGPMGFMREDGVEVRAMTPEMMEEAANRFATAAKDAKNLGFDMVFMHFGHGWLAPQFLSPLFNQRSDEYGGSFENRAKFPKQILERVRQAVGKDYPVDMRISAVECVENSITFEDTLQFIKLAEPLIDTVHISAGLDINHEGNVHMATTIFKSHKANAEYAGIVKRNVKIPVSVVGAVMNPSEAEELIASGTVDLVAFGRNFIADPDWPNKAKDGFAEDIVPCIRCLQCYHISTNRRNVGCSVNPRYKNEGFISKTPGRAETKKKIAVIGAGPAGIIAALTCKKRGHNVILFEKKDRPGGVLRCIAREFYKEDIRLYLQYLNRQLDKSGIDVRYNTTATPEMIRIEQPDVIFVAVGAKPLTPGIKGIDNSNVIGFFEAMQDKDCIGENVAVIGGGMIGAEIALELAELQGKNITIIEVTDEIAAQGNILYRIALRQKMDAVKNITKLMETTCREISSDGVTLRANNGKEEFLKVDTIIIATGVKADKDFAESFYGIVPDTFVIGDCERPGNIMDAIFDGYAIASRI